MEFPFGVYRRHAKSWVLLYERQFHRISDEDAEVKYQYIETIEQDKKYYLDGDVTRKHFLKSKNTGNKRADGEEILEWIGATELHYQILYVHARINNDIDFSLLNSTTAITKIEIENISLPLRRNLQDPVFDGSLMLVFHDKNLWINDSAVTTQAPPLGFSWKCYKLIKNENQNEHKFYANNMQTLHKSISELPNPMRTRRLQNCLSGKLETELLFFSKSLLKHDVSPQEIHHFYEDLSNMILREWITLSQPQPFTLTHSSSLDSSAERFELVCTMYEQPRVLFLERAIRQHYDIKSMTWLTEGLPHDDALDENSTDLSDSPYNAKLDLAVLAPTIFDFFASDLWYSRELVVH